jgi:phosphonate transport system permease protein
MPTALATHPPERLAALVAAYDREVRAKRGRTWLFVGALALAVALSGWMVDADILRLARNIGTFTSYFDRLLTLDDGARVWTNVTEWYWGLRKWSALLLDTLLIAYLGTLTGALFGFLASFAAASNLMPNPWIRGAVRRFLEFCRTVPEIVFALIFVVAFGLGPIPGVLAIAIHTTGALGKLFSEVCENIDMKPVEGAVSTGATWPEMIRFAVVPQVLANYASYALLRFEINVRGAAVMGFVGAGGIGQDLIEAIRKFYYSDVSAILLLIIATVVVIDLLTERLRHALIGREAH